MAWLVSSSNDRINMNIQSIILAAIILGLAAFIVYRMVRRKGRKPSCCDDCDAADCSLRGLLKNRKND